MPESKTLDKLNEQLTAHMEVILRCAVESEKYGRLLLASPPASRYPYVYPRDASCAVQLFRRLAGSDHGYEVGPRAFGLMKSLAHFMKDVVSEDGNWGQRYSLEGEDKSLYKQEDNVAHGAAIICNYLLTAHRLKQPVDDLEGLLNAIEKALCHALREFYQPELNLFQSTTSIHESAMEEGYTCWVNFALLYAFSLANEVADKFDQEGRISRDHLSFRKDFLHSVNELFMSGNRYVRRVDPQGHMDFRPDFTLLSPFFFGFLHYRNEMERSVDFLEKQLWDPQFGMIMRYLPFSRDFTHPRPRGQRPLAAIHGHPGPIPLLERKHRTGRRAPGRHRRVQE